MRFDLRRLLFGALLGLGLIGAVTGLIIVLDGGTPLTDCVIAAPLGWTIPLASVFVIAGLAWLLLSQPPQGPLDIDAARFVDCPACGRSVLADWRLCPYCGSSLAATSASAGAEEPARG